MRRALAWLMPADGSPEGAYRTHMGDNAWHNAIA
jgi:hypothetical protein